MIRTKKAMNATDFISVRLKENHLNLLRSTAAARDQSVSELVREAVLEKLSRLLAGDTSPTLRTATKQNGSLEQAS